MAGLEDRVERLASALERMLDQGSFSGVRNTGGTTTGGTSRGVDYDRMGQSAGQFVNTLGQAAQGNVSLVGVLKEVNSVLGNFGPVVGAISNVATAVGANLVQMNQNMMSSSKFGMGFSQNIGLFTEELGKAGIAQEQWVALLQSNAKYLSGSATTAQEAAQLFLKQNQELRSERAVQQAILSGIDFSEFQDQLLINTNLMKFQGIETARTQKILQESVVTTVGELDNMARITGKSRQEIQKGVDQQQQTNTMRIARLSMSAEQLARYNESLPKITSYGTAFANLFTEMSGNRGNVVSRQGTELQAALNLIAPGVGGLMRELSQETNKERRAELQARIDYEMAKAVSDEKSMERFNAMAERTEPGIRQAVEMLMQGEGILAAGKEMLAKTDGTLADFTKYQAEIRAKAEKERQPAGAGATEGNATSVAIQAAQEGLKTIAAGLAMGTREGLDKLGKEIRENVNPKTFLEAFKTQAITPENLIKALKEATGYVGTSTAPGTMPISQGLANQLKIDSSTSNPVHVTGKVTIDPVASQAAGSKDTFGSWFGKDWGAGGLSMLHGNEAVVPSGKMVEFINDMVAQSPGMLNGLQGSLRNAMSEANPNTSMQKAIEQFTSAINIPSTVSSTTSSTPVNGTIVESKTTSDLHAAIEKLNTKMDKLITAVEDSGNANVKAVKSRGNLIA